MTRFIHRTLPSYSALLAGSRPPDQDCFISNRLQIWMNRTTERWQDPAPHFHADSDEIFIVLSGEINVEVEGERIVVGPNQLCAFPPGVIHSVVDTRPPVESLMIRAPSIADKTYVASIDHTLKGT